jgi:uncharacterized membrane protein
MDERLSTRVDASPDVVWALFTDLERWPELTKSIESIERREPGALSLGSEAVIKQPRLPKARWKVTAFEPGRSFEWETSSRGVTTVGGHAVEADGTGATIILTLRQHGPFAWLAKLVAGRLAREYLSMELEGFRREAESRSTPS